MDRCREKGGEVKMFRKATMTDVERIANIYSAIHDEKESGRYLIAWTRFVYPVAQTAIDSINRDDMFVQEVDGLIVAAAIINKIQTPEFANCTWKYDAPDDEVMVLHTLVVDPEKQKHGYGTAFVRYYEEYALQQGCRYLRMDTNVIDIVARSLYLRLGYHEAGIVPCVFNGIPNVNLVCLEKKL